MALSQLRVEPTTLRERDDALAALRSEGAAVVVARATGAT